MGDNMSKMFPISEIEPVWGKASKAPVKAFTEYQVPWRIRRCVKYHYSVYTLDCTPYSDLLKKGLQFWSFPSVHAIYHKPRLTRSVLVDVFTLLRYSLSTHRELSRY